VLDTTTPVDLQFSGRNFVPSLTTVTYGPAPAGTGFTCTVSVLRSTPTFITCTTFAGSQGALLVFKVTVAGQSTVSTFQLSFPQVPRVFKVTGCTNQGNTTIGCPTEGGIPITLYG
jgi:hypothetical protein